MNHDGGAGEEKARRLSACSDHFLEALGHLPVQADEMALPRTELITRALEYRLKAYVCAVRGGAPATEDIARLATLAVHCGLTLAPDDLQGITQLVQRSAMEVASPAADSQWLRSVCDTITAQTFGAG